MSLRWRQSELLPCRSEMVAEALYGFRDKQGRCKHCSDNVIVG